jgi:hypothetical protein
MPKYEIGKYEVEITGQGFQKASTGTLQFVLQFKVQGKVDPRDPQTLLSVAPGERKWYKAITEKTVDWLIDDLKVLGVEGITSWAQLDPTIAPDDFIDLSGKLVDMMCGSKNGTDGKSYEDWSIAREGGPSKPIENAAAKDVKALDRLFGKSLKAAAPAARGPRSVARPAAAAAAAVAEPVNDEDVPF